MPKPSLRVTGLHVEGLRALRKLDWPENGMGWNGRVPDVVLVGGVNGSGKTTLLELIAQAARLASAAYDEAGRDFGWFLKPTMGDPSANALVDFEIAGDPLGGVALRIIGGDEKFVNDHLTAESIFVSTTSLPYEIAPRGAKAAALRGLLMGHNYHQSQLPGVVYFPSRRDLVIPDETYKAPGKMQADKVFVDRVLPVDKWRDSLEATLYAARWLDLNAMQQGHAEAASVFEAYEQTFQRFFHGTKRLMWSVEGELFVEVASTKERHPLTELSSGEKQVLLMAGEMLRRWRPGSLILIDEPELHLHPLWQTRLWDLLIEFQKERGGQVIVATQSNHLFRIAAPDTKMLLGMGVLE